MHFSPTALLVFVAFCVLVVLALSAGSNAVHAVEGLVAVLILMGVGGFAWRDHRDR